MYANYEWGRALCLVQADGGNAVFVAKCERLGRTD